MSVSTYYSKLSRIPFNKKILAIFIFIVIDAVTTVWLMMHGHGEANPIMAWVVSMTSPSSMAVGKIIWSMILIFMLLKREEFRKYIDYLIICYFFLYAGGWWIQLILEAFKWTQ